MKRFLILAIICMAASMATVAQTSFYTGQATQAVNIVGSPQPTLGPIPFAGVRVCNLPLTQAAPCLPLATVTDANGNTLSNSFGPAFGQLSADSFGRFTFGCTTGANLRLQYTGASNTPQADIPITCPGSGVQAGGNNIFSGSNSFTGATSAGLLNNTCYVDGVKYLSIASANADTTNCRVIVVPAKASGAKYTETLSANFIASSTLQGIDFETDATITMGTNTFTVNSSATTDGFFIRTPFTQSGGFNANAGVRFVYTGSATPFTFGQTTQRNFNWHVGGIEINIQGAGTAITGMQVNNMFNSDFSNIQVTCIGGGGASNTQTGMLFNAAGTPGFSDLVYLSNDRSVNCQNPLHLTNTNGYVVQGGATEYNCGNTTGGIGIKVDGASGGTNFFVWPDLESCPSFGFDISNSNNVAFQRVESLSGIVVKFEAGVVDNYFFADTPGLITSTDSSGNARNHATTFNGAAWPNGATPDIFPSFMAAGTYGWQGSVDLGGTTGGAGLIALARGAGDTGGTFYGLYANSKSGGQGGVAEVGVSAATGDGGIALQTGVAATTTVTVGCKWFAATAVAYDCVEGAAPVAAASHDQLWPDSTAHAWKMNNNNGTALTVSGTVVSGTSTLTSNATLGAGTCQAVITTSATGAATTDSIEWSFATNPATGDAISPVASSVTANNVNFTRCNPTAAAQNVTAIVINWRVIR